MKFKSLYLSSIALNMKMLYYPSVSIFAKENIEKVKSIFDRYNTVLFMNTKGLHNINRDSEEKRLC